MIEVIPDDKLVLESDRSSTVNVEAELLKMLGIYTEVKGWSGIEEAARRTATNAGNLYAPADLILNATP